MATIRNLAMALTMGLMAPLPAPAGVEVSAPFGSNMVLQRDLPVPVWGKAAPGEQVTVTFAGRSKQATADAEGRWSVKLDALAGSGEPRELIVKGQASGVTFKDVLVGEVWLVLADKLERQYQIDGPAPMADARVIEFDARDRGSTYPRHIYGQGRPWGPGRSSRFAAVTIAFVNALGERLGVPVGIVQVSVGDLPATTPVEGFAAVDATKDLAEKAQTWNPSTTRGRAAYEQWLTKMKQWTAAMEADLQPGKIAQPTQPPLIPGPIPGDETEPTVVFNGQLSPLTPFAIRGVMHLDAASSAADTRYADEMRALAAGLRAVFQRPDMPVVLAQRAQPDMYEQSLFGNETEFDAWYGHRDRQRRAAAWPNTGMVVTLDVEDYPGFVGGRLAQWALAGAYDKGGASSGPIYKSHRVEGNKVIISFDHADGGLMAAGISDFGKGPAELKDGTLRFFSVAGEDRVFHSAEASIQGDTVVASSGKVPKPVAVRYACRIDPRGMNLYNKALLPASPFRTDDWPIESVEKLAERLKDLKPDQLAAMLGDPGEAQSHAAAKVLGQCGEPARGVIERLVKSDDPDRRSGALRALGYAYWRGPVDKRKYYGAAPQEITPAIAKAVELVASAARDKEADVRLAAVEALSLIGSEDDGIFRIALKLAVDDDARIRTAVMKLAKFRLSKHEHIVPLAYALFGEKPFCDRTSANVAGNLLNHQRLNGPIDLKVVGRYFSRLRPGQGSGAISDLGDTMRRIKLDDGTEALNSPDVLPGVLNLYAIGYRNYMLYGVERWIAYGKNVPAFRAKIDELTAETDRLKQEKPEGWKDLAARYADAIEGLRAVIDRAEKEKPPKKAK
jgi:sialate O-acetylesterase